jgi:hypothetical protein
MLKDGNKTGVKGRPKDLNERIILATQCVSQYKFTMPMVIDGMEGKVNRAYQAAPVRVTVVDVDGKVAFYAGRGPFDFRIPPVERTLRKLAAHKGHMPPPPVLQWSEPANGLRCGLSFDPQKLRVGEDVVVRVAFQNITDEPIALHHTPAEAARRIAIRNDEGQTLKVEDTSTGRRFRMRRAAIRGGGGNPVQRIGPGQIVQSEIEAKIVEAPGDTLSMAGQFHAAYTLQVDSETAGGIESVPAQTLWIGTITSGTCTLYVTLPRELSCMDCHGDSDYHHVHVQDCTTCHVGKMGEADFDTRQEACVQCHPREGVRGRRQVLGPGGEFSMASRHLSGTIEDKDCLTCHDRSQHGSGVVNLIDPDSGGTRPWAGTRVDFCLTCHDGDPPAGVFFPDESTGSGFAKMKFADSAFGQTEQGCSLCHNPHGSPYPSLLKNLHAR